MSDMDHIVNAVRNEMRPMLTVDQVAEWLGVTRDWVLDQGQKGRLPVHKLGSRTCRYRPEEIEAFINGTWQPEAPPEPVSLPRRRGRPRKTG